MSRFMKWTCAVLAVILVALIGMTVALRLSQRSAREAIPEGTRLTLRQEETGALRLSWPAFGGGARYYVEIAARLEPDSRDESVLFSETCEGTQCALPAWLPDDLPVMLRVTPLKDSGVLAAEDTRYAGAALSAACYLNPPKAELYTPQVEVAREALQLRWAGWKGDRYRLCVEAPDGTLTLLRELEGVETELDFGAMRELSVPEHGASLRFVLQPFRETPGLLFEGRASDCAVTREDFLGTELRLDCTPEAENVFLLRWNETKGAGYQLLARPSDADEETTLAVFDATAERAFRTGHLAPYRDYTFRVVAFADPDAPERSLIAASEPVEAKTGARLMYATVWSLQDMDVYTQPNGKEKCGVMRAADAYCVLGETDGWLRIGTPAFTGYVDGNRCMVNLPDYIGDLCSYDITNSYSSVFRVHEYDIPRVTGTEVSGYETVRLAPENYLVPLLYPTAKKLIDAAELAAADGYRLKIYDSFRPNRATRSVYDLTASILYTPLPERTYSGTVTPADGEDWPTYFQLMTNGTYGLNSFLASGGSRHNYGVALDLTLETAAERSELRMQTAMHDLSWYSSIARNNDNANLLRRYMFACGFGGLTSEWWHFQDDEIFAAARLANRWAGVEPRGWRMDDGGWRYRLADGSWLTAAETVIDGAAYRFGPDGYLLTGAD